MNPKYISSESSRAPGLPYQPRPSIDFRNVPGYSTRYIEVASINYDYLPMSLDSPKTFWVDLPSPPPADLMVGSPAKLHITSDRGIQTKLSPLNPANSVFEISDVIGSRIILSPYRGSTWLPTVHASCDNPFGWGYNMRGTNVSTNMHNTKYGYGVPISYLEYHPIYYSSRALRLQAAQLEDDYYRNLEPIPGWKS